MKNKHYANNFAYHFFYLLIFIFSFYIRKITKSLKTRSLLMKNPKKQKKYSIINSKYLRYCKKSSARGEIYEKITAIMKKIYLKR